MSECITSDTGIQPCDPNSNSMATAEASSTSIFKNRPFFFFFCVGGWDGWLGGRGKACEFRRVGSLAPVGGDGLVVVSFLQRVFPLSSYPGITPRETSHRSRCEIIRWEASQWKCYFFFFFQACCYWSAVWPWLTYGQTRSSLQGLSHAGGNKVD